MQEEVENRTVNLAISTTKLTGRTILNAYRLWKSHHNAAKAKNAAEMAKEDTTPHGKQTIQELIGQNQGVSSIDIQNTNIRDFEKSRISMEWIMRSPEISRSHLQSIWCFSRLGMQMH